MVSELHKLGYQRLRILPGMAPSGMYWRCAITPSSNVVGPHGLDERDSEPLVARYSTADENKYFGWADAPGADARQLATLFLERFPEIAQESEGEDWAYAGWYVQMLGLAERGFFPIAYSDWGADFTDFLPLLPVEADADTPRLRVPPLPTSGKTRQ
jgi:hypothetical protein